MLGPLLSLALLTDASIIRRSTSAEFTEVTELTFSRSVCCFGMSCQRPPVTVRSNFHAELRASAELLR